LRRSWNLEFVSDTIVICVFKLFLQCC
ncbi:unnamed protein product, partial [Allacma fusca]